MYPQIFGKYVLERELASGGMAQVFVATLRGAGGFEKRLALKQIRPELASDRRFVERFIEEAKTAVDLTHPNIVAVYELGVEGGVYYIAMELCSGVTLAELLGAEGALGLELGAYVGVEVARALDYAHRRGGIVHRDVTPRNVLIDDEGAVRLIDFGIARPVAAGAAEVFGSPGHMPPEQVRGEQLGPAADVFALGALVYEACAGIAPFRRGTEAESLAAVSELPEPPSRHEGRLVPLDRAVLAAVAPDVRERLQSAEELGRALREVLRGVDLGDVARELGSRVRRIRRRSATDDLPGGLTTPVLPHAGSPTKTFATRRLEPSEGGLFTRPLAAQPTAPEPTAPEPASPEPTTGGATGPELATDEPRDARAVPEPAAEAPVLSGQETSIDRSSEPGRAAAATSSASALARWALGGAAVVLALWGAATVVAGPRAGSAVETRSATAEGTPAAPVAAATPARPLSDDEAVRSAAAHPGSPIASLEGLPEGPGAPHPPSERAPAASTPTAPGPAPSLAPSGTSSAPPASSASPAATPSAAAPLHSGAPSAPSAPGDSAAPDHGTVTLTAVPPASVVIAGRDLRTPVSSLSLPLGEYQATFTSPTWDGAISAKVRVEAERPRHVHADFTSEPPRVVVK